MQCKKYTASRPVRLLNFFKLFLFAKYYIPPSHIGRGSPQCDTLRTYPFSIWVRLASLPIDLAHSMSVLDSFSALFP